MYTCFKRWISICEVKRSVFIAFYFKHKRQKNFFFIVDLSHFTFYSIFGIIILMIFLVEHRHTDMNIKEKNSLKRIKNKEKKNKINKKKTGNLNFILFIWETKRVSIVREREFTAYNDDHVEQSNCAFTFTCISGRISTSW